MPRLLILLLLLSIGVPTRAESPKRTHSITIDDYFSLAHPAEVALSPDGQVVAYTELRWQKSTDDRKADLWVVDCTTGKSRRLTFDRPGVNTLHWSPDSR